MKVGVLEGENSGFSTTVTSSLLGYESATEAAAQALPTSPAPGNSRHSSSRRKRWLDCFGMGMAWPEKEVCVWSNGKRLDFRMCGYGNVADLLHQILEVHGQPPKGWLARLQTNGGLVLRHALLMGECEATELHLVLRRQGFSAPCGCSLQATCAACGAMVTKDSAVRFATELL
jgi:hypothetical protein